MNNSFRYGPASGGRSRPRLAPTPRTAAYTSVVTTRDTQEAVEHWLRLKGHQVIADNARGGTPGPDYVASVDGRRVAVEVIGHKRNAVSRSNEFRTALFQLMTRLDDPKCQGASLAVAMPVVHVRGSRARRVGMGAAWDRLGNAFPELAVWYVDMRKREVYVVPWLDYGTDNDPVVIERERRKTERRERRQPASSDM